MKTMKGVQMKALSVALGLVSVLCLWVQGAEIRNVTAVQRWPWNGKVDILYEVEGELPANAMLTVTAEDLEGEATYVANAEALSGDTGGETGTHHVVWDLDAQGVAFQSTNTVFTASYHPALYCVVDLSAGVNSSSYPVTWMDISPTDGFNTDEYKTEKLVLRCIEAGTFTMGSPRGEVGRVDSYETQHQVTLTKPFYIGVFEVTQRQWELVAGDRPSWFTNSYSARPVENVSYDSIRGSSKGANWPTSDAVDAGSFLGKMRVRTGLMFDLPTEAQWEYACRAGTTTALNSGKNLTKTGYACPNMNEVGRCYYNGGEHNTSEVGLENGSAKVGSYQVNDWGLYDMHGNVGEWCADWLTDWDLGTGAVVDPKGSPPVATSSSRIHVVRGGAFMYGGQFCRSAYRDQYFPSGRQSRIGFRLSCAGGL